MTYSFKRAMQKLPLRYLTMLTLFAIGSLIVFIVKHKMRSNSLQELFDTYYTFSPADFSLNGPNISMDNPMVIKKLRDNFLIKSTTDYNLKNTSIRDQSMGQVAEISKIIDYTKGGFFIEYRAFDGEERSNTLFFERFYNWTGLLIEADPSNFVKMLTKGRRAYLSPTCLSVHPYSEIVTFHMGPIETYEVEKKGESSSAINKSLVVNVQCFPLYTYLLALNLTVVDYFSLDVEGSELNVLKTIPFDKIDIKTLSVELTNVKEGDGGIKSFLKDKGYVVTAKVTTQDQLVNNYIFAKPSVLNQNISHFTIKEFTE